MHNIKEIRDDVDFFKKSLIKRYLNVDVDKILYLDEKKAYLSNL